MVPFACCLLSIALVSAAADTARAADRLFELRTYTTNEGKLDDLHKRFREHTNKLFVKHGMDLVGYWTPEGEGSDNTLVYMLAYPDREAREKAWQAFRDDPDWQAAYKASTANGRLVKKVESWFLSPTDYSPTK
ncbi:MAG: NIPSNAP family protein [Planctomycetota bacterium]|nr:MAG: NIPSNAP family protein [Planctomycetota bacterium]